MINDPLYGKIKCVDAEKLQELLKEIKPMDLVPVIRCKDCKHKPEGRQRCFMLKMYTVDDFFCAAGERKEDGRY